MTTLVVIVDDSPSDQFLNTLAAVEAGLEIETLNSGQAAIDRLASLRGQGGHPALMVVDVNMACVSGFDVLRYRQENLGELGFPAVILTTSNSDSDAKKALHLGAAAFFTKPKSYPGLVRMMEHFKTLVDSSNSRPGPRA